MTRNEKVALIFGAAGQDGAYLSQFLHQRGYVVHGTSRDRDLASTGNLRRLGIETQVTLHSASLHDFRSVVQVIRDTAPAEIYNLAAQSSVGLSFEQPFETIHGVVNGTLNILEALRFLGLDARFYNASSSECFGDTGDHAADETTAFRPCSPYGVAKASAHWLVSNYRQAYGLFACSGILFNHESPLRPARFVTQKIIRGAVEIAEKGGGRLKLGNLEIARDWGWAPEYVDAMWRMLQQDTPEDFVIATGETHPLHAFVARAFARFGLDWREHVEQESGLMRPSDIGRSAGNSDKARQRLGWQAQTRMPALVDLLIDAELERRSAERR